MVTVAGVDALRAVAEREVAAGTQAGRLEDRPQELFGRARVRGGLEHDERAGLEVARDVLGRRQHHREVGAAVGEGRRKAQHDHVGVGERAQGSS